MNTKTIEQKIESVNTAIENFLKKHHKNGGEDFWDIDLVKENIALHLNGLLNIYPDNWEDIEKYSGRYTIGYEDEDEDKEVYDLSVVYFEKHMALMFEDEKTGTSLFVKIIYDDFINEKNAKNFNAFTLKLE